MSVLCVLVIGVAFKSIIKKGESYFKKLRILYIFVKISNLHIVND